jgi:ribonuclease G
MKGSVVAVGKIDGREVAALMVDGRLEDLALEAGGLAPGAILRGTVGRPVKGLGGVFVDLPDRQSGFLRQTRGLTPGRPVLVQVSGVAEAGKALPLSTRLLIKGRFVILTPDAPGLNVSRQIRDEAVRAELTALAETALAGADPSLGLILRSACESADPEDISARTCWRRRSMGSSCPRGGTASRSSRCTKARLPAPRRPGGSSRDARRRPASRRRAPSRPARAG